MLIPISSSFSLNVTPGWKAYTALTLRIGHNGVAVPDACFKALLVPTDMGYSSIAFLMSNGGENRSLGECALTVDELETLLEMDFFCNLPDKEEVEVENKVVWEDWGLR